MFLAWILNKHDDFIRGRCPSWIGILLTMSSIPFFTKWNLNGESKPINLTTHAKIDWESSQIPKVTSGCCMWDPRFFPTIFTSNVGYIYSLSNFIVEYLCFDAKSFLTVARQIFTCLWHKKSLGGCKKKFVLFTWKKLLSGRVKNCQAIFCFIYMWKIALWFFTLFTLIIASFIPTIFLGI